MNDYYTIIAVSISSLVPVIYGIIFSLIFTDSGKTLRQLYISGSDNKTDIMDILRMIYLFILSFFSLVLIVRIAVPVPSEGWLRTLFIIILLSAGSVCVFSIIKLSYPRLSFIILLVIILLFMAAVPAGLLSHNPWNYIMFISPLYWVGWAWVIPSAPESIAYSGIAIILTIAYLLIAGRLLKRRDQSEKI